MFKYVASCSHVAMCCLVTTCPHLHIYTCRHFDKEKSGRLNHQEFKSCLRSLGYDLPMVEEGEPDPEFEAILDTVDPNRSVTGTLKETNLAVRYLTRCLTMGGGLSAGMATSRCRSTWRS